MKSYCLIALRELLSRDSKKRVTTLLLGCLSIGNYAVAQENNEEVFELSPFSVQAEEGWIATETLAGSRLRTNFKDVASQVEIMTMEFMDDFAVNSVEESLIYSVNVSGPEDYVSGNGEGFGNSAVNNFNQIRGVLGGTLSRNFFQIDMPTDNYNVSRVTIASGPNSILFGTGSPAGVLDVTLNRAQLGKDFGTVEFEWDSWNGKRYVFDYNKSLIEDKLALRIAWMDDNAKQDIEPNHDKSTRTYGTLLYKPLKSTTLSLHAEKAKRDVNRVNRFLPFDRASPWFKNGMPVFNNVGGNYDASQLGQILTRHGDAPTLVYEGSGSYDDAQIYYNTARVLEPTELPGVWNLNQEADGWTFLDGSIFPDDVNYWGTADKQFIDSTQYNAFLEQKIAENLYVEFGYNLEDFNQHEWGTGTTRLVDVDVNAYRPNGDPNPHFGEFFIDGNAQWQYTNNNRENWRATVSYEFDFADRTDGWVSKLGRHRLASLVSNDKYQNTGQQGSRYRWLPDVNGVEPVFPGFNRMANPLTSNNWATDGSRNLNVRHYLTAENGYFAREADGLTLDGRSIQLLDGAGNLVTLPALDIPFYDANGRQLVANNAAQGISNAQDTLQFAYQGYFWNNKVVLTYGWRQDEASSKTFDVDESAQNSGRDAEGNWLGVYDADGNRLPFRPTGLWPSYEDLELKVPGATQKGITRTTGVVFHATENLSLHYNESDTFQPNIGRFDPYGAEYPGANGDGKDYGFSLTFLEGKMTIRYNEFETLGGPQRAANTPFNRWRDPIWNVENRWRSLVANPTYPGQGEGGFREKGRCCYWVMSDKYSEGTEVIIAANPVKNLNLRFTWTDREAVESNIGAIWGQYMAERLPVWMSLNVPEGGANDPRDLDGDGEIGTWTWDTAWYSDNDNPANGGDTLAERHYEQTIGGSIGWALIQSLDGKANEFDRTGRWNFNASYRITEGKLKGLTYGGAMRWRESPVVGYGISGDPDDPDAVVNLDDPKLGAEDFTTDVFASYRGKANLFGERNYKVQLNVRNVLDEDDNVSGIKDINGKDIRVIRKPGRQFVVSFELDI